jgi:hypothetical protein
MHIGYPSKEVLQITYVSVLPKERFVGVAYLIDEADILSGKQLLEVAWLIVFFSSFV